eukprot:2548190-Lingulodinium_polyedra.AAC.1
MIVAQGSCCPWARIDRLRRWLDFEPRFGGGVPVFGNGAPRQSFLRLLKGRASSRRGAEALAAPRQCKEDCAQ